MTKADLIALLAEECDITKKLAEDVLAGLERIISDELVGAGTVTLPGIVKLTSKPRAARPGRNPRTGEAMEIAARTVVTAKVVPSLAKVVA